MRKLLLAATALTVLGFAAGASAQQQDNSAPIRSTTTVTGVNSTGGSATPITSQAIANFYNVDGTGAAPASGVNQNNDGSTTAITTLDTSNVTGATTVQSRSAGNTAQIAVNNAIVTGGGQQNASAKNATTSITNSTITGSLDTSALATGSSLSATSAYSTVSVAGFNQFDQSAEQANLTLNTVNTTGVTTGLAQAIANSVSITAPGANTASFTQTAVNAGGVTASASLSNSNLPAATANTFGSLALGNTASLTAAPGTVYQQTGFGINQPGTAGAGTTGPAIQAGTTLSNSTLNGSFSAQAVGNALTYVDSTGVSARQLNQSAVTGSLSDTAPLVLNGTSNFSSLAGGNQFAGTTASQPVVPPGYGVDNQANLSPIQAGTNLTGLTGGANPVTVDASAFGNTATLTSTGGGFAQGNGRVMATDYTGAVPASGYTVAAAPVSATTMLTNSTFASTLSVTSSAVGNSLSIHTK